MSCPARHLVTLLVCGLATIACGGDADDGASVLDATDASAPDTPSDDDGLAAPDAVSDDDGQAAPDTTSSDDGLAEPDAPSDDDGLAEPDAPSDDDGLAAPDAPCSADCDGKACGGDGCGGSCGSCGDGLQCDEAGQCVCAPDCDGKDCGDDGCGGFCGPPSADGDCHASGSEGGVCTSAGQCDCGPCASWSSASSYCQPGPAGSPFCWGSTIAACNGIDSAWELAVCPSGCTEVISGSGTPECIDVCGDGHCAQGGNSFGENALDCPEDCDCGEGHPFTAAGCEEGSCALSSILGDGTCDAVFDCAEHDHDGGDCEAPPPGCEPTGPGQYVQEVLVVPANPTDCTETSIVLSGIHPGLNYDFGTTNTGVCQPPFNCGASEAIVTLNLTATVHSDNPPGPDYEATFDLGELEAYTYCVRVLYGAAQGVSEEIRTSLTVTACD